MSKGEKEQKDLESLMSWLDENINRLKHNRLYSPEEFDREYEVRRQLRLTPMKLNVYCKYM